MSWPLPAIATGLLGLLGCLGLSCGDVDGGAVELSWTLRSDDGDQDRCAGESCCAQGRVANVRMWWQVGDDLGSFVWNCTDNRAVTPFEIPPGEALLWVEPECESGATAAMSTFVAPTPLVRTIAAGDLVTINAQVLLIRLDDICLP